MLLMHTNKISVDLICGTRTYSFGFLFVSCERRENSGELETEVAAEVAAERS